MVRVTNAVAARARNKKMLKRCKGFYGDRKNHLKQGKDAIMSAMAFNYLHRKQRKRDFRRLWTVRINVAAKINGISYNRLINGLKRIGCNLNRKLLSDLAIRDPEAFTQVVGRAKEGLVA